ncbi:MAG: CotH kinase family protein [Calditrichaceae bacterium]|nr:CotH kinase family protein [Calditrichaceae bacterium]
MKLHNLIGYCIIALCGILNAQGLKINEVMSSNTYTVMDEDNDYSDWFEIYNPSDMAVSLKNWYISDDSNNADKWQFPDVTIPAYGHLLIFASDKDRKEFIAHWETIITQGDDWKYIIGSGDVPGNWREPVFNDDAWAAGPSGFGYGDGDDATEVEATMSVFIRKSFVIDSLETIVKVLLHVDFDDAFVAYLNGVEIARSNIGVPGTPPAWNDPADNWDHEAKIYSGGVPDKFDLGDLSGILTEGENVLAIEVHNYNTGSSDLSLIPFLTLGLNRLPDNPAGSPDILNLLPAVLHTNFKLSASGEMLVLSDSTGAVEDLLIFPSCGADISYGHKPDGSGTLAYFDMPTPGFANDTTGYEQVAGEVYFDPPGGLFSSAFSVTLSADPGSGIYYTLDGSEPDESSDLYTNPVPVTSDVVIRARVLGEGLFPGRIITNSYLFRSLDKLPVISLVTDPYNLWDTDYGIYVLGDSYIDENPFEGANFWEDWERPVHVEYFKEDGTPAFRFDGGTKIHGGWSRARPQKSMSFFLRGRYGADKLTYQLFHNLPIDEFTSFILRNSANDWDRSRFADGMMQDLVESLDLETQAFQPCVVYMNGVYWGILNMREKINEDYLAAHFDIDPDNVDILESDGQVVEGDDEHYLHLLDFLENNDMSVAGNYNYVKTLMEVDNFIDYYAAEIYFDNRDWPGNNIKFWRPKEEGGRWRWLLYDTDWGFGINAYGSGGTNGYDYNTLAFATSPTPTPNHHGNPEWSTFLIRHLLENEEFKHAFINRFADHMNTIFLPDVVVAKIDSIADLMEEEMQSDYQMWSQEHWWSPQGGRIWWGSFDSWYGYVQIFRDFAVNRPGYMRSHVCGKFGLSGCSELNVNVMPSGAGKIKINTVIPAAYSWSGIYFNDVPVTLTAIPALGYKFNGWSGQSSAAESQIELWLNGDGAVSANFIPDDEPGRLVLNEINYKSTPARDSEDWIEIYNFSSADWDISGYCLTDSDPADPFVFPAGMVIKADSFLVICRDTAAFKTQFPQVKNFTGNLGYGLSSDGEYISIRNEYDVLLDSLTFGTDDPWPSAPNGGGPTLELLNPSRDNALAENWGASSGYGTPGRKNSTYTAIASVHQVIPDQFLLKQNYPNPFNPSTNIEFQLKNYEFVTLKICDILGREVVTLFKEKKPAGVYTIQWNGTNNTGQKVGSGVYYVLMKSKSYQAAVKMVYIK